MKKNVIIVFLLVLFSSFFSLAQAQQKNWAVGIRFGEPTALNVKKYIGKGNALDINIGSSGSFYGRRSYRNGYYDNAGFALMINYLWQKKTNSSGLQWYYGLGGQLTSRRYYYYKSGRNYYEYDSNISLGVTGMIGLEYFIPSTPISLFVDASPYLEIFPAPFFLSLQAGLGGRINF